MSSGRDEMMEKWNTQEGVDRLTTISHSVDEFYSMLADTYGISLMQLNAIILARLVKINKELGTDATLNSLMGSIVSGELTPQSEYLQ